MPGIEIIFFDIDGTLFDYVAGVNQRLVELHRRFMPRLGATRQAEFLTAYWAVTDKLDRNYLENGPLGRPQAAAEPLARFSRTCEALGAGEASLPADLAQAYRQPPLAAVPFPGVEQALAVLRRRWRLGIITGGPDVQQRERLASAGLAHWFDPVVASDAAGAEKPDPRLFQTALDRAGATAQQAMMVGNHPLLDLVAPAKLGLLTVLFTGGRRMAAAHRRFSPFVNRIAHSWDVLPGVVADLALAGPLR